MAADKILIVEDDFYFSELICDVLANRGLTFDLFVRAEQTDAGIAFMEPDGKKVIANLDDYWLALVDSRIRGSVLQGKDLASALSKRGLSMIAISGVDYLNDEMVKAGAMLGIRKDHLWLHLLEGKLDLITLVKQFRAAHAASSGATSAATTVVSEIVTEEPLAAPTVKRGKLTLVVSNEAVETSKG